MRTIKDTLAERALARLRRDDPVSYRIVCRASERSSMGEVWNDPFSAPPVTANVSIWDKLVNGAGDLARAGTDYFIDEALAKKAAKKAERALELERKAMEIEINRERAMTDNLERQSMLQRQLAFLSEAKNEVAEKVGNTPFIMLGIFGVGILLASRFI